MKPTKVLFSIIAILALIFSLASGCSSSSNTDGGVTDSPAADGGGTDQSSGADTDTGFCGDLTFTFNPASGGAIKVKGACITITLNKAPSPKNLKAVFKDKAGSNIPGGLKLDEEKATLEFCPFPYLKHDTEYDLEVSADNTCATPKSFTGKASFKTDKEYAGKSSGEPGLTVDLKIKSIISPAQLESIAGPYMDQVPPILIVVQEKETGDKGKMLFVGGLGKGKHDGKGVVDTETPVSLALDGNFDGRLFSVGPNTFVLSISGYNIRLNEFQITGLFSTDGKNIEAARLLGIINADMVKERFNMDVCLLVRKDCYEGPTIPCKTDAECGDTMKCNAGFCATPCKGDADCKVGETCGGGYCPAYKPQHVRVVGALEGIPNPIPLSAFITSPVYLQTAVGPKEAMKFYISEQVDEKDITVTAYTCKDSTDSEKPCDTKKGAKVEEVKDAGTIAYDAAKKSGTWTPKADLTAGGWYKIVLTVTKDKVTFSTRAEYQVKK